MQTKSLGFIGGGRITNIFLQGFYNKNLDIPSVLVYDINSDTLGKLKKKYPHINVTGSIKDVASQEIVFIALHPPVIAETMQQIKEVINEKTIILSLAPKFSIEKLAGILNTTKIVRMIPNATSYINQGYNPVCFSDSISNENKSYLLDLLKTLGKTLETEENKLEPYAIASAMLPTYFWFQWKEMEAVAKQMGLSETESQHTIYETLKASLELMYNSNMKYEEVTDLIPVKPIAENEQDIKDILNTKLISLFNKIKP